MSEVRVGINGLTQNYATIKNTYACSGHAGAKFDLLNAHILNRVVYAGEFIIIGDNSTSSCTSTESYWMQQAQKVRHSLAANRAGGDGAVLKNYDFLQSVLGNTAIGVGMASDASSRHLKQIGDILEQIKAAHHEYRGSSAPNAQAAFFEKRGALFKELDRRLNKFSSYATGLRNQGSIKRMLQLSTKSFMHTGELVGYANKVGAVARATSLMKKGVYLGIGLNVVSTGLELAEACSTGREDQCTKAKYIEIPKLAGSIGGGGIGGFIGAIAAPAGCTMLGIATAGAGGLVCTVLAGATAGYAAGNAGSWLGEEIGSVLYNLVEGR